MGTHARGRRGTAMAALAALAALGAAACGGGGSSGGSTTSAGVQPTAFQTIPVTTQVPLTSAPPNGQPGTTAAPGGGGGAGGGTAAEAGTYTVRDGDTLVGIAKKLGVTLQALLDANGMNTNSLIYKGLKLKIPTANAGGGTTTAPANGGNTGTSAAPPAGSTTTAATTPTTLPGAGGTYTVVSGDTWFGIAKKLGVKAEDLAAFNDKTTKDAIHPGDKLQVPPPSTSST